MPVRLNKVVREFNVGLQTVVDYLEKRGYKVDSDMNAKLSDDEYQLIKEHFGTDKTLRNEAKEVLSQRQTEKNKNPKDKKPIKEQKLLNLLEYFE